LSSWMSAPVGRPRQGHWTSGDWTFVQWPSRSH